MLLAFPCFGADSCACISVHDRSNLRNALGLLLLCSLSMLCFLCYPAAPSSALCHVVVPDARLAAPLWQRRLRQPGCGAAPQGPPRGAPGDGDARSRAGVRCGLPATAHALPRVAPPASSLDTQRPAGPRVPTCAPRIKRQVTGSRSAPLSKGTGARRHGV